MHCGQTLDTKIDLIPMESNVFFCKASRNSDKQRCVIFLAIHMTHPCVAHLASVVCYVSLSIAQQSLRSFQACTILESINFGFYHILES